MAQAGTASHIDFKLEGKPQVFSGSECGWIVWSFQMKNIHRDVTDVQSAELINIENLER